MSTSTSPSGPPIVLPTKNIKVTFEGAVLAVHVWLGANEIALAANGDTWTGNGNVPAASKTIDVKMNLTAPAFTEWTLVAKCGSKKVVDDGDTSDVADVTKSWLGASLGSADES